MKKIALFGLLSTLVQCQLQQVPGTLDPTFGGNGTGFDEINLGGTDFLGAIAIDTQGRIVAGGRGAGDVLIMRFTPDGILDTSFGGNGTGFNLIDFGAGTDILNSITIDSQGRIVAGGGGGGDVVIMRFTPDGILDTTFGGSGTGFNQIDFGGTDQIFSVTLDTQERIVAGGAGAGDALIMRFTPDGILDTTFGGSGTGFNLINLGATDQINSITLDIEGKIVAGGTGNNNAAIMRFTPDGILDTTFGGNGTGFNLIDFTPGLADIIFSIKLDSQGRIIGGGSANNATDALLIRFTPDGILDVSFGGNGTGFNLINIDNLTVIVSLSFDPQGRIIGGGSGSPDRDILIIRFNSDGVIDKTFGGNGTGFNLINTGGVDEDFSLVITSDGKIVAGGRSDGGDVLIMRFYNDPLGQVTIAIRQKYCGNIIGD